MKLGERIKEVRKNLNLTQEEFCKRIGLKRNSISLVESGKRNISDQALFSICREFSVNEAWLRTGEGEMWVVQPDPPSDDLGKVLDAYKLPKELRPLFEGYLGLSDQARKEVQGLLVKWARDVAAQHADKEESPIEPEQKKAITEEFEKFNSRPQSAAPVSSWNSSEN